MTTKNSRFSARARAIPPAPCTIYRPDATGELIAVDTVIRASLPAAFSEWEPDVVHGRQYTAMCLQETGEARFVARGTRRACEIALAAWLSQHPEHSGGTVE